MLSGLFKPDWQSNSVEKRIQAIEKMDAHDAANQPVLEVLANDDLERSVRKAAINKLTQPGVVFQIRQTHNDDATRAHADLVFSELIGANSPLAENDFRTIIQGHPGSSLFVAKQCPHSSLRAELVNALSESEQAALIADVEYSDTRTLIAQQLNSLEPLECARKLLRGKDKNAERIIKSKLDEMHARERQAKENLEAAERLCDSMEYLANHHEWRPEFKDQYLVTKKTWETLDFTPDEYLQHSYQKAFDKVRSGVEHRAEIESTQHAQTQLAQALENDCIELAGLSVEELIAKQTALQVELEKHISRWSKSAELVAPDSVIDKQFASAHKTLSSVIQFCKTTAEIDKHSEHTETNNPERSVKNLESALAVLSWPDQYPALEARTGLLATIAELKAQADVSRKQYKEKLDKLHKKINRTFGSTKRGELPRARRELAAAIKAASHYVGADKIALDERLEKATIAVDKMADWKDFATEPKYLELCEAMEALASSKSHPDKLSAEIAKLQQRWKALGHSESADQHWHRFKAAGEKAYEPCALFFKQRHEKRLKNLESREPLVKQLQDLLDSTEWDSASDFKPVESALRKISNDWQKIKDVEPGPGQKQWKRFSKLKIAVYEKLDVIYDANITIKNDLIAQAEALFEAELKDDTFSKLQKIQSGWKDVGVTRRKQDQAAWKKFKKTTDNVYEKIQDSRKAKRAEEDEHLKGYRDITREIHTLTKSANDLAEADSNFERLQSEYKALPPLPRGLPEKLLEGLAFDYKKACEAFNKAREGIIRSSKNKALDNLAKKATLCTELEALAASGTEKQIAEHKNKLAALEITDNELRKRFDERLAAALDSDRKEATEVRRLLCIDLEILLGIDSPAEDKALRMKIQLERLQKGGFGQGQSEKNSLLKKLKLDWYCLSGAEPDIQKTLEQRFAKLMNK